MDIDARVQWSTWPASQVDTGTVQRLVDVLEELRPALDDATVRPWALVGGLAVLGWAHSPRATIDVDVTLYDRDRTIAVILQRVPDAVRQSNGVRLDSVDVDLLEAVDPGVYPDADEDADFMRNLVWHEAIRLSVSLRFVALDGPSSGEVEVPAARPGLLLGMKLAAIASTAADAGQHRNKAKQGSDVFDIVSLVETLGAERLLGDLELADQRLSDYVREQAEVWLVGLCLELSKRTRKSVNSSVADISPDRVEQCGLDLLDLL